LNVSYALYVDGLSLPFVALTALLTSLVILSSDVAERSQEYYALFLLLEAGLLGTFLAVDFILFLVFCELCLVPLSFLIGARRGPDERSAPAPGLVRDLPGVRGPASRLALPHLAAGRRRAGSHRRLRDPCGGPAADGRLRDLPDPAPSSTRAELRDAPPPARG